MGAVVFRAKHRAKAFARAAMHHAQEFALCRGAAIPIIHQGYPAAVFQDKTGHIDCLGPRVRRSPIGPGNIPAGIAAHGFNAGQRTAQNLARSPVNTKACPIAERIGHAALHCANIADPELAAVTGQSGKLHRAQAIAARRGIGIGQGVEPCAGRAEI